MDTIQTLAVANFFLLALAILWISYYAYRLKNELKRSGMLRKESEKYRDLFNTTWDGVFRTDPNGSFLFINRSGAKILGYSDTEELINTDVRANVFYDGPGSPKKLMNRLLKDGFLKNLLVKLKCHESKSVFIELTVSMKKDEHGELSGFEGIFRDVSERIAMDEELEKHRNHLEDVVKERTVQLENTNRDLEKEILERKKADRKIKASLREKEALLKEIHHRVKNNLQVISSLLGLQSRQIEDKRYFEMFRDTQNRVHSMASIHEKLYSTPDFAKIDFTVYIEDLARDLYRSYEVGRKEVELEVKINHIFLGIDLAIPCGLIINELVSNALKYAFPPSFKGKKKIAVMLRPLKNETIELIVMDNGIGMPEEIDIADVDSLGLQLVSIIAGDQLEGEIQLDRDKGTSFKIRFKASETSIVDKSGRKGADQGDIQAS